MTEPRREDEGVVEREAREAARGESARTPLLLIGGVGVTIAIVVGVLILLVVLIWLLA
ncbi:MAG TPA: hypothetical protein VFO03_07665 [Gaiellaceae bacterium]|nr:hypothetical protein [Gaiellaceae bacterium]